MKRIYNKFKGYTPCKTAIAELPVLRRRRKGKVTCLADKCVCADEIRQAQKRKERSS